MPNDPCPICERSATSQGIGDLKTRFECVRCGTFDMGRATIDDLPAMSRGWDQDTWSARLSHAVRRMQVGGDTPFLTMEILQRLYEQYELPTVAEQADNLLLLVGDELRHRPAAYSRWGPERLWKLVATIGARDNSDAGYVAEELAKLGEIEAGYIKDDWRLRPTFKGWQHYHELKQRVVESRVAFMAMPFGDDELDLIYQNCLRPAVKDTGFELRRIDDPPRAGSIPNRMRVEIHRARFLVAEVTGENSGVYWEAGLAEGLGRPVIYTHREDHKPHFDTAQLQTVRWSADDLKTAGAKLKVTIRATLPAEAIMDDN